MNPSPYDRRLRTAASLIGNVFTLLALAGLGLGVWLVHSGANPPPGEGSLGHVGMIVGGAVLLPLSLILALIARALARWGSRPPRGVESP